MDRETTCLINALAPKAGSSLVPLWSPGSLTEDTIVNHTHNKLRHRAPGMQVSPFSKRFAAAETAATQERERQILLPYPRGLGNLVNWPCCLYGTGLSLRDLQEALYFLIRSCFVAQCPESSHSCRSK